MITKTNKSMFYFNYRLIAKWLFIFIICFGYTNAHCQNFKVSTSTGQQPDGVIIASKKSLACVAVDTVDYPVVKIAAELFADDVNRVTGKRPRITGRAVPNTDMIIAGTLGHSGLIDQMVASGKLKDLDKIKGHWEATLWQIVSHPFPGVKRAFVIVGSDRRGTAYGLTQLSQKIGVSPWCWWADVAVSHKDVLRIESSTPVWDEPGVKYRGIFINDEDWGLNQWAKKTFDPVFKNIGPKTYEKVFELMLRLRLNYIWPAMHPCSTEFGSVPENVALADRYGIVAGSSHCEPMLCNNVHWNEKIRGPWNYSLNRDTIYSYWQESTEARSAEEAVWTMGIRGIHDSGMEAPPKETSDRLKLVTEVFQDQQKLLNQYVSKQWGPIAKCFVPYKEVLPIYDAGLKVPDDVTLVWVDDNFGYIRRLSSPDERKRSGGAGVYWHLSYYGHPHSYTWINTTPPALMWEELHKGWENDARTMWVLNVGDIKPMEIGIDYFAHLAWKPEAVQPESQPLFLEQFTATQFGNNEAKNIAILLGEFYRLGTIHKPELMNRAWAMSLNKSDAAQLRQEYQQLLKSDQDISTQLPQDVKDSYVEMVGFPARVLAASGLIFLADRDVMLGTNTHENQTEINRLRSFLENEIGTFNNTLAGGKWKYMMPGMVTGTDLTQWNSQVAWPWGEPKTATSNDIPSQPERTWRNAASADRRLGAGAAKWTSIPGLGSSGSALVLTPATLQSSWALTDDRSPTLEYNFQARGGNDQILIDFLPTFRIHPGMKLRVAVSIDNEPYKALEVPGSDGSEDEWGPNRKMGVQNNYVQAQIKTAPLTAGNHVVKIRAIDPGIVIDKISLE